MSLAEGVHFEKALFFATFATVSLYFKINFLHITLSCMATGCNFVLPKADTP